MNPKASSNSVSVAGLIDENQLLGRFLAVSSGFQFELDALALTEILEARALDRRDVDERVLRAALLLDESEPLDTVEPLHGSSRHVFFLHSLIAATRDRDGVVTVFNDVQE